MEYVKIPRKLIYDTSLDDKRVLLYSALLFHCWDERKCDLSELSSYCGFCVDRHSNTTEKTFKSLINSFHSIKLITVKWLSKNVFTFFSQPPTNSYGVIYKAELEQLMLYRKKQKDNNIRINHSHLVLLLSYIRLNMDRQPGVPMMHFSLIKTISENTGMSTRSISYGLKLLKELSIIYYEELPRFRDEDGNWHTNVKVFVNAQNVNNIIGYDCHYEIKRAIAYIYNGQR